jgi:hypothetical protein
MRFVVCGSMAFSKEMLELKIFLEESGHQVMVPYNADKYASGDISPESNFESTKNKIEGNLIQEYFFEIRNSDAVIVVNYEKKGIKNYIGGNSFLEAGFAHALDKKLFFCQRYSRDDLYR